MLLFVVVVVLGPLMCPLTECDVVDADAGRAWAGMGRRPVPDEVLDGVSEAVE